MNSRSSAVADALAWVATILAVAAAAVGLFVTGTLPECAVLGRPGARH